MKTNVGKDTRRSRRLELILGASFLLLLTGITLGLAFAGMGRVFL